VRRVALLCCHCLSNNAYYYAGRDGNKLKRDDEFSRRVNGNFMDLCTLEFCKLFGEQKGEHHWRKVVTDEAAFLAGLLKAIGMTAAEFDEYIRLMKFYRNKYVAHLDAETGGNYPDLSAGKQATAHLLDYVLNHENDDDFFPDMKQSAADFYAARAAEGEVAYK
jgi:hypothetical protein